MLEFVLCGLIILILIGCAEVHAHDDFTRMVSGRSEADVIKSVGAPAAIEAHSPTQITWTYRSKTVDTGKRKKLKPDAKTLVIFEPDPTTRQLRVASVIFERD